MISLLVTGLGGLTSSPIAIDLPAPATAIAVARDSGFAVGDESGVVREFDSNGRPTDSFIEAGPIGSLAFSPDGRVLATGFRDDGRNVTIGLWTRDGKLIRYFDALKRTPPKPSDFNPGFTDVWTSRLAWSPDGRLIAAEHGGHLNTGVRVWDISGKLISELGRNWKGSPRERFPIGAGVKAVEFSRDGTTILTSMDDGYVRLWRTDGGLIGKPRSARRTVRSTPTSHRIGTRSPS